MDFSDRTDGSMCSSVFTLPIHLPPLTLSSKPPLCRAVQPFFFFFYYTVAFSTTRTSLKYTPPKKKETNTYNRSE